MKITAFASAASLAALLAVAACGPRPPTTVRDTGNMAFPAPLPQGNVANTPVQARIPDTGNMAYPAPRPQGVLETTQVGGAPNTVRDTGSAQLPAPRPQGRIGTTVVQ